MLDSHASQQYIAIYSCRYTLPIVLCYSDPLSLRSLYTALLCCGQLMIGVMNSRCVNKLIIVSLSLSLCVVA